MDICKPEFSFLMIISGYTIAVFKKSCYFYLFDSHSRDERGLTVPDGKSCLLKFANINELEKYIQVFYLEFRSLPFQYFQIQFIEFPL